MTIQVSMRAQAGPKRAEYGWGWAAAVLASVVLLGLATLPPFVSSVGRFALMEAFSSVCHQLVDRTFHFGGIPLAVCHRCYGIYMGVFFATLLGPLLFSWFRLKPPDWRVLLGVVSLPLLLDWGLGWVGIWENSALSRILTGLLFGLGLGACFVQALMTWGASRRVVHPAAASVGGSSSP